MAASNTKDAVRELIGKRIVGVLFDTIPLGRADLSAGTKTLVFDDGTGFTVTSHGAFWRESENAIARAGDAARARLENAKRDIEDVLVAAGARSRAAGHDQQPADVIEACARYLERHYAGETLCVEYVEALRTQAWGPILGTDTGRPAEQP